MLTGSRCRPAPFHLGEQFSPWMETIGIVELIDVANEWLPAVLGAGVFKVPVS